MIMNTLMSNGRSKKKSDAGEQPQKPAGSAKKPTQRPRLPIDLQTDEELDILRAALSLRAASLVREEFRLLGNSEMALRLLREALREEIKDVEASRRK